MAATREMSTGEVRARTRERSWSARLTGMIAVLGVVLAGLIAGTTTAANAATWNTGLVTGGPTLSVTAAPSTLTSGTLISVTGSGFTESTQGVYVDFGSVNESGWRPSAGASTATRSTHQTVWISDGADTGQPGQYHWGATTGTFSFTLTLQAPYAAIATYYHVYTENAHGVALAANEQAVRVPYTGTTVTPPVYTGTGHITGVTVNSSGKWVIDGADYPLTPSTGIYVSIGTLADAGWKPSLGYGSSTRVATDTVWAYPAGPDPQSGITAKIQPNGTFSVTLDPSTLPASAATGYHFAASTIGAHGVVVAGAEDERTTLPSH